MVSSINLEIVIRLAKSEASHDVLNQQNTNFYSVAAIFSNSLLCDKVPMSHERLILYMRTTIHAL